MILSKSENILALDFIKMAKTDLTASQLLYESSLYPQAVYSLQQAIEKSTKSFGLALGVIDKGDLQRNVGHISSRVFFGWKERTVYLKDLLIPEEKSGIIEVFNSESFYTFKECTDRPKNYRNLCSEQIDEFINKYRHDENSVKLFKSLLQNNQTLLDKIRQRSDEILNSLLQSKNHKFVIKMLPSFFIPSRFDAHLRVSLDSLNHPSTT